MNDMTRADAAEWFARQNRTLFGTPRDNRCDHHTYYESISMKKKFKVLVQCDDYKGHLGTHHFTAKISWTDSHSLNDKGKER